MRAVRMACDDTSHARRPRTPMRRCTNARLLLIEAVTHVLLYISYYAYYLRMAKAQPRTWRGSIVSERVRDGGPTTGVRRLGAPEARDGRSGPTLRCVQLCTVV